MGRPRPGWELRVALRHCTSKSCRRRMGEVVMETWGQTDGVLRAQGRSLGLLLLWFDGFWKQPSKAFQEFRLVCLRRLLLEDQGPRVAA